MENEVWKDVEGFEGRYQVSNYGRVKSLSRMITRRNNTCYWLKEKILTPTLDRLWIFSCPLSKGRYNDII